MNIADKIRQTKIFKYYKKIHPGAFCEKPFKEIFEYNRLYRKAFKIVKNYNHKSDNDIIVSLTSYPARIKSAGIVISAMMQQTIKPKKIVLTLSSLEFPKHKLPKLLKLEQKAGLEIIWTDDDLRSHKKYFYVMQKYPKDIIITVDDDNFYQPNLIETLYNSYKKFPDCISCIYARRIAYKNNKLLPYECWTPENIPLDKPSIDIFAVGVGGVLYPPNLMHKDLFDKELIKKLCFQADDIWLKYMQMRHEPPTKVVKSGEMTFYTISVSQISSLQETNRYKNMNDVQINEMEKVFNVFNSQQG